MVRHLEMVSEFIPNANPSHMVRHIRHGEWVHSKCKSFPSMYQGAHPLNKKWFVDKSL